MHVSCRTRVLDDDAHAPPARRGTSLSLSIGPLFALVLSLVGTCAYALPDWVTSLWSETSDYPIANSGYEGASSGRSTVAWIDNDRVLFVSTGPLLSSGEPRRSGTRGLYLWDTRSGNVKRYYEPVQGFCFADGMLRYWGDEDGSVYEYAGRIGEERKHIYAEADYPRRNGWHLNPLTCEYYRDEKLPAGEGVFFRPLRAGDGYLGGGTATGSNFTIFLPHGSNEYRKLELPTRSSMVGYSELQHAYVLREAPPYLVLDSAVDRRFWLFSVNDVHVQPLVIPAGPWLRGDISFVFLTPSGVVFTSHAAGKPDRDGRPTTGAAGVYMLSDRVAKRIMAGYPYSAAITADGCKVVTSIAPRAMAGQPAAVKFVDVCAKER